MHDLRYPSRSNHRGLRARAAALLLALSGCAGWALAAPDACQGAPHCQDLGPFTATVVKVNVTRQGGVTAYQGVRTTVRFTNTGNRPLILGYRDRSSVVTDNNGLPYRYASKALGMGLVARNSADPQFQLAPGESREATFDGVLQYNVRHTVPGQVFSHDLTIVQLAVLDGQRVREVRDHAIGFTGLQASAGFGASPLAAAAPAPVPVPATPPPNTPPDAGASAARIPAGDAACETSGHCQATGPLVARVVRVNVTKSGNVTAYQTVRTTVRFTNVSAAPLILGYRDRSGVVADNQGHPYTHASKAQGIGVVSANAADPQFRLAPGQSREAVFESTLQYNVRHAQPGTVFTHDLTVAELAIAGPGQVRTLHEYALSFSNLSGGGFGAAAGGGVDAAVQSVGKVVDLLKGLRQ